LVLICVSLALPLVAWLAAAPGSARELGLLLWMTTLLPAFVLSHYGGWRGTSTALAAGMAVLAIGQVLVNLRGGGMPDWRVVVPALVAYVALSVGAGWFASLQDRQRAASHRLALTDPVTGLPNRRHTQITLNASVAGARAGTPLSLVLFDLDGLRWLNEEHGHEAGDQVLREVGGLIRRTLRDGELVGRWGGGEFLVILPAVTKARAVARADALRTAVRDAPLRWQPVTVSAGVASHDEHTASADALVSAADEALREAKRQGPDQLRVHEFEGELESGVAVRGPSTPVLALAGGPEPASNGAQRFLGARIVVVDDEGSNLRAFGRALRALGFANVESFQDPVQALASMDADAPDLVLLDLMMPEMDGFQVLERMKPLVESEGYLPVLILTGERQPEVRERALRMGGRDFLNKPVDLTELEARILNLLETRALHLALREARDQLEERVRERTRELEDARVEILRRLARAAEYRDDATGRHQERVGILAERIAVRMEMDPATVSVLRLAAPLHDVGKIAIPDDILRKPGPLTDAQYARMREHTRLGAELLSGSPHRVLEVAREIALSHHERWDGKGYPAGRAGNDIPVTGRIVAVADVFDSLLHQRPYKEAIPMARTLDMIRKDAGTAFDPRVVRALEELAKNGLLEDLVGD
jgi:putative two-component system response regulator